MGSRVPMVVRLPKGHQQSRSRVDRKLMSTTLQAILRSQRVLQQHH